MSLDDIGYGFIDEDEFVEHHGVKGMKWGVRKSRPYSKRASIKRKLKKFTKSNRSKKEDVKSLSDDELNKRIARLQKERQYKELSKSPSRQVLSKIGKTVVGGILLGAASKTAKKYVSAYMDKGVALALKKANLPVPDFSKKD